MCRAISLQDAYNKDRFSKLSCFWSSSRRLQISITRVQATQKWTQRQTSSVLSVELTWNCQWCHCCLDIQCAKDTQLKAEMQQCSHKAEQSSSCSATISLNRRKVKWSKSHCLLNELREEQVLGWVLSFTWYLARQCRIADLNSPEAFATQHLALQSAPGPKAGRMVTD